MPKFFKSSASDSTEQAESNAVNSNNNRPIMDPSTVAALPSVGGFSTNQDPFRNPSALFNHQADVNAPIGGHHHAPPIGYYESPSCCGTHSVPIYAEPHPPRSGDCCNVM